jgi:hypothetical protein
MPSLNQCYNDVTTNAGLFRNALVNLHSVLSTDAPVLYIATTDKKQKKYLNLMWRVLRFYLRLQILVYLMHIWK